MLRYLLLLPVLAAAPLALAEPSALNCGAITETGEAGSGLSERRCTYAGASISAAYRAYLAYEQASSERASSARLLPAQLPNRSVNHVANGQTSYRVSWQGRNQVQVVLTQGGDLPVEDTYRFRRRGGQVEITRLYQAP